MIKDFSEIQREKPDYVFDPLWVIEPDGRIWLREVSLIRNPNKTTKVEENNHES